MVQLGLVEPLWSQESTLECLRAAQGCLPVASHKGALAAQSGREREAAKLVQHLLKSLAKQSTLEQGLQAPKVSSETEVEDIEVEDALSYEEQTLRHQSQLLQHEAAASEATQASLDQQVAMLRLKKQSLQLVLASAPDSSHPPPSSGEADALLRTIKALGSDIASDQDNIVALEQQLQLLRNSCEAVYTSNQEIEDQAATVRADIASQPVPNLEEKTAELLKADVELQDTEACLLSEVEKWQAMSDRELLLQARLQKLLLALNAAKALTGDCQQQAAAKAKDLELSQVQRENLLAQQVMIRGEERRLRSTVTQERALAQRTLAQIDASSRALQLGQSNLHSAQHSLAAEQIARKESLAADQQRLAQLQQQVEPVKKDVEVLLMEAYQNSSQGPVQAQLLAALVEDCDALEAEQAFLKRAELAHADAMRLEAAARSKASHHAAQQHHLAEEAKASIEAGRPIIKATETLSHEHQKEAIKVRHLCKLLCQQRNSSLHFAKAMREQAEREVGEQTVLQTQLNAFEALTREKGAAAAEHQAAKVRALSERNKLQQTLISVTRESRQAVEHQHLEASGAAALKAGLAADEACIHVLGNRAQATRLSTVALQKAVERQQLSAVGLRDQLGDFERVHELGVGELAAVEDAVRTLHRRQAEVDRCVHLHRRTLPNMGALDTQVAVLKTKVMLEQAHAAELSSQLELPRVQRPGAATSEPPAGEARDHAAQIRVQAQVLQQRLEAQEARLVAGTAALEEATGLADHLLDHAARHHADNHRMTAQASQVQAKLSESVRAMKAYAGEMSMYKVSLAGQKATRTSLRIQAERLTLGVQDYQ
ncbi:hypothetical protein WJX73_001820 [Symbiochloris irregularis]|uniref:Uncharacterized protein n=1 Tax=Symbiochloris irregularis TaxID=706552 RepID=A0AAW1PGI9_9CHLO